MTAPQETSLVRGKKRDEYETEQMTNRISYIKFNVEFKKGKGAAEVKPCGHCGARVYLEGVGVVAQLAAQLAGAPPSEQSSAASQPVGGYAVTHTRAVDGQGTPLKRPRLAADTIKALIDAKALKDAGVIDSPEFRKLKDELPLVD